MQLKNKKIYIADDDENVLEVLTTILQEEGAEVISRHDGKQLFTSVSLGKPDCVIIDLYMPVSNGFDSISAMKEFLILDCPILVLTGHATEENIQRALASGATECMAKPISANELIDKVVDLITKKETPYRS